MIHYLQTALSLMVRRKVFPTPLLKDLNKLAAASREKGLWVVIEEVSQHLPDKIDMEAVVNAWCVSSVADLNMRGLSL